ncbi:MAG: ATP-binding protein, partial [Chloroflexota bacterium]
PKSITGVPRKRRMKSRQLIPEISNLLKKLPSLAELEILLDLYPNASILLDKKTNNIVVANRKAAELTAYTRPELVLEDIKSLMPDWAPSQFAAGQLSQNGNELRLVQRSGMQTTITANSTPLGDNSPWILLTFDKKDAIHQKELQEELDHIRWQALNLLAIAPQKETVPEAIHQMLQAGQLLTGANTLYIYFKTSDKNNFNRVYSWGNPNFLPEEISENEISHLKLPFIWEPGQPTTSSIHRNAFASKAKYIASIPLDINNSSSGLLVVMDQISSPPIDLLPLIEIIAGTINTLLIRTEFKPKKEEEYAGPNLPQNINLAIQDSINDGIIFASSNLSIVNINKAAILSLGYSKNEAINHSLDQVLVGAESIIPELNRLLEQDLQKLEFGEFTLHARNGKEINANISAVQFHNTANTKMIAIIFTDNSLDQEYRIKEKQLEQQALLGEVTAIFAHEVRNPINNISTRLQLMAMNFPDDDPIQNHIENLNQDCNRLTDLMKSVLSFSGPKEYKLGPVNIKTIADHLLMRSKPKMDEYNIKAQINVPDKIPSIKGDRRALEQVLTNIFSNAIQAMKPKGGVLGFRIEESIDDNMFIVSIADSGPGISEEIKNKIFDPFFTTHSEGTGLGLSITKRIISAHNGHLSVESWPGGTIFYLKFPLAKK